MYICRQGCYDLRARGGKDEHTSASTGNGEQGKLRKKTSRTESINTVTQKEVTLTDLLIQALEYVLKIKMATTGR